jgi:hypothetical protein
MPSLVSKGATLAGTVDRLAKSSTWRTRPIPAISQAGGAFTVSGMA